MTEPKDFTLGSVLTSMAERERFLNSPDFDPKKFVGELDPTKDVEQLKTKVDAIIAVVEDAEEFGERMKRKADEYLKRWDSAQRKAGALRKYILFNMKSHGFEQLPGNQHFIGLNKHHTPKLIWTRAAVPEDVKLHPDFVRVIPRQYEFMNEPVKAYLLKVASEGIEFDFARLEYSEKIEFKDIDQPIVNKKKGNKK